MCVASSIYISQISNKSCEGVGSAYPMATINAGLPRTKSLPTRILTSSWASARASCSSSGEFFGSIFHQTLQFGGAEGELGKAYTVYSALYSFVGDTGRKSQVTCSATPAYGSDSLAYCQLVSSLQGLKHSETVSSTGCSRLASMRTAAGWAPHRSANWLLPLLQHKY